MKRSLANQSVANLVEAYVAVGLAQDEALGVREIARYNRLTDKVRAIEDELKSRDGDQRRALLQLLDHRNLQVQMSAAVATLAVAPEKARQALESIAASKQGPQCGYAGMTLLQLDEGIFRPT